MNRYDVREDVIKFYKDYLTIMHTARCHATHRKGLKILAPKLMLQKLKIAHAQVKPGNTSENLLSETRQIVNFLLQAKEITKKVYNNMINSITL